MTERSMVEFVDWVTGDNPAPAPGSGRQRRWRRWAALPIALALLIAPLSVVVASHMFPDVPDSDPHHTTISRIATAGITAGCGGTANYCPADPVTRAQMATFLHRGLGRVAADEGSVSLAPDVETAVASLTITPGYATNKLAGANGFLKIDGSVTLYETAADLCDCFATVEIFVDGVNAGVTQYVFLRNDASYSMDSTAVTAVVPVSANGARTVEMRVHEYVGGETLTAYFSLSALYVPFGSTGTDLLGASSVDVSTFSAPGE